MKLSDIKKEKGVKCCAYGCSNKPAEKLGGLCYKHYQRQRRILDPVGVRYSQFKINALKRGKVFEITLDEFRHWCKITGYCIVKGRRGKAATIDRRCNVHGYFIWNIQLMTLSRNASKGSGFSGDNFECPF